MKILIWIFSCFIIVGIPNALLWQLNLQFGAIPTMILTGAAYLTAKTLCKKWDEHKADKKDIKTDNIQNAENTENAENTDTSESDYTVVAEIPDIPKVEAEFVGADDTKHSFRKLHIGKSTTAALIIISLLLASSVGGNIYLAYTNKTMQTAVASLEDTNKDLQTEINSLEKTIEKNNSEMELIQELNDNLAADNIKFKYTLDFYEEYVVIVSDDNTNKYHIYGCKYCDTSDFWAFNIDYAKAKGYSPCRTCCY